MFRQSYRHSYAICARRSYAVRASEKWDLRTQAGLASNLLLMNLEGVAILHVELYIRQSLIS